MTIGPELFKIVENALDTTLESVDLKWMNDIDLLDLSIRKWEAMCANPKVVDDGGVLTCACCMKYHTWFSGGHSCEGCPISTKAGLPWCSNTPYNHNRYDELTFLRLLRIELQYTSTGGTLPPAPFFCPQCVVWVEDNEQITIDPPGWVPFPLAGRGWCSDHGWVEFN